MAYLYISLYNHTSSSPLNPWQYQVWTAVDVLGCVTADFLERVQRRLTGTEQAGGERFNASGGGAAVGQHFSVGEQNVSAGRFDYYVVKRILRPLVMAGPAGVPTPAAALRLWCHEVRCLGYRDEEEPCSVWDFIELLMKIRTVPPTSFMRVNSIIRFNIELLTQRAGNA